MILLPITYFRHQLTSTMGKYKRKTNRQSWSEESMKNAIMSVINKVMGYKKASMAYGVPQTTLENRVKKYKQCDFKLEKAVEKSKLPL